MKSNRTDQLLTLSRATVQYCAAAVIAMSITTGGERAGSSIIQAALAYCNMSVIVRIVRGHRACL